MCGRNVSVAQIAFVPRRRGEPAADRSTDFVGVISMSILATEIGQGTSACSAGYCRIGSAHWSGERYRNGHVWTRTRSRPITSSSAPGPLRWHSLTRCSAESDAHVVMVDRNHRPGGHWNHAYSFVGLHQPSAFYGVNSRELSSWTKDQTGLNQGMYELSSGAEVLSYFDQIMRQRFLPSGRVHGFR